MLSDRTQRALRELSNGILQSVDSVRAITIDGHVAFAGTNEGRQRISRERGERVAEYLIKLGIPQSFIETTARAADEPAATNSTEEGRALNRRAEITIITQ